VDDFPEHAFLDPGMVASIDYSRTTRGRDKSYSREWKGLHTATKGQIRPGRINTGYTIAKVADLAGVVRLGPKPVAFDACDFPSGTMTNTYAAVMYEACRFADGLEVTAPGSEINRCVVMGKLVVGGGVRVKGTYVSGRIYINDVNSALDGVVVVGPVSAPGSPALVVDSYSATGWLLGPNVSGFKDGYCRLSRPGQLVVVPDHELDRPVVEVPDDGTIGVVTESESLTMFGDAYASSVKEAAEVERRMRTFSSLLGRPKDDSDGLWLDGRNHGAWTTLIDLGGIDGDEVNEESLSVALALSPNP